VLPELAVPELPPSPRGTARPVVDPPPRRWSPFSARSGLTGARRGASYPPFPIQPLEALPDDELPPEDDVLDPPEPDEEDDPEDEPESRGPADPTVGLSAGRDRSCAQRGVRLSAKAAAVRPIVDV